MVISDSRTKGGSKYIYIVFIKEHNTMVRSVEVIKERRPNQRLGIYYYAVLRDSDNPNSIAVYQKQGWTLFRVSKYLPVWPRSLADFPGETNNLNLKLSLDEASNVKHELGLGPMDRISVSEVYLDTTSTTFVDKTR